MYVDNRAKKRYNAYQNVAKSIRQKSSNRIQMTIRNGQYNFLLRQKEKGDQTPWNLIPPVVLEQRLPEIEIGLFNNIYKPAEDPTRGRRQQTGDHR